MYALIEAHNPDGGLYRSDDAGESWQLVNPSHSLWQRPWYYMHVIADPRDENVLYIMDVDAYKSTDGGHLFNKVKVPHGDNHGLWIDPQNTRRMIASNDGGVTVTLDGGKNWTTQDNQPTAQFYHVITDSATPYRVYGPQQDSGTVGDCQPQRRRFDQQQRLVRRGRRRGRLHRALSVGSEYCLRGGLSGKHHALRPAHRPGEGYHRATGAFGCARRREPGASLSVDRAGHDLST